jgi:hypothetical protein
MEGDENEKSCLSAIYVDFVKIGIWSEWLSL